MLWEWVFYLGFACTYNVVRMYPPFSQVGISDFFKIGPL